MEREDFIAAHLQPGDKVYVTIPYADTPQYTLVGYVDDKKVKVKNSAGRHMVFDMLDLFTSRLMALESLLEAAEDRHDERAVKIVRAAIQEEKKKKKDNS